MPQNKEVARKRLNKLSQEFTATQMLYLLGETLLLEVDEKAEVRYDDCEQPHHFIFKMKNGRQLAVLVMEIKP